MKYAIIKVVNHAFTVEEGFVDLDAAKTRHRTLCASYWNDKSSQNVCIEIVDENLDAVPGFKEFISHDAAVSE